MQIKKIKKFEFQVTKRWIRSKRKSKTKNIIVMKPFKDNNACQNNPCLNGATCAVTGTGNTYICTCRSGYSGTNCQICKYLLNH